MSAITSVRRERLVSVSAVAALAAAIAVCVWLYFTVSPPAAIGGFFLVGALYGLGYAVVALASREFGAQSAPAAVAADEHLRPLLTGGTKAEHKLSRTFRERRLILPNRASAARRKRAAALDAGSPAPKRQRRGFVSASRALGALTTGWGALRSLRLPERSRKHGRHAATVTDTQPVPSLLHGEPAPEPAGEPEAIAHEDVTEPLPALPAAQEDPTGRLFPWATGEFAAFMEAGEPA